MNNSGIGNSYTIRLNFELAGNLLYAVAKLGGMKKNALGNTLC